MYIYGLFDPRTKELRYIGFTAKSPVRRLQLHKTEALTQRKTSHKNNWLRNLYGSGNQPGLFILEETNKQDWQEDERWNISYFKSIGCRLTNHGIGGEGNTTPFRTEEFKKQVSEKLKGRIFTEEHRKKLSLSQIGNKKGGKNRCFTDVELKDIMQKYFIENISCREIANIYGSNYAQMENVIYRWKKKYGFSKKIKKQSL